MSQETIFHSPTFGDQTLDSMLERIAEFIKGAPHRQYKVIVGTDSEAAESSALVTAVTVCRVGNGAIYFWTKLPPRRFGALRARIMQEALNSIMLAQEIRTRLKDVLKDEFFWDGNEIHVDVGENGPTKELVDGVVGMIRGYNFIPVIKPAAFGASSVADRHT